MVVPDHVDHSIYLNKLLLLLLLHCTALHDVGASFLTAHFFVPLCATISGEIVHTLYLDSL